MYILFDIGGTRLRIASSPDGNTIEKPLIFFTPPQFNDGMHLLEKNIKQLAEGSVLSGIAGGIAGPLNQAKSMVSNAPNLSDWINQPLKKCLETSFGCPVYLENDAALAGLGEAHFGQGQHHKIVAYLTVSTGVGGVRIADGKIEQNERGFEPGHQIIDPRGPLCLGCQRKGHLEAFIGGASLTKRYGKKPEEITDKAIWEEVAYYLAIGINNIMVHWSPDCVILGGPLMARIDMSLLIRHLTDLCQIYPVLPHVASSTFSENGLYGGLVLLHSRNKNNS